MEKGFNKTAKQVASHKETNNHKKWQGPRWGEHNYKHLKKNHKQETEKTQKGTRERQNIKRKKALRCNEKERTLPIQQVKEIKWESAEEKAV